MIKDSLSGNRDRELMVSQLYSRKRDVTIYGEEFHNPFKKSRQEEDQSQDKLQSTLFNERPNSKSVRSLTFDFQLPLDWQKSTEPKGYSRTCEDHRTYLKEPVLVRQPTMSLDLELNLSPTITYESSNHNETMSPLKSKKNKVGTGINRSSSWLEFDVDQKEQEMVTTVCMKCHMLVMLCTSTLVCPNCKFMHPHDHHHISTK